MSRGGIRRGGEEKRPSPSRASNRFSTSTRIRRREYALRCNMLSAEGIVAAVGAIFHPDAEPVDHLRPDGDDQALRFGLWPSTSQAS